MPSTGKGSSLRCSSARAKVVNSSIFGPEWMGVPEGLDPYAYDPELATSLLDGSGFDKSQEISIMHYPGQNAAQDAAVAIMQEQLNQVGFNIEILQVDVAELLRRYVDETTSISTTPAVFSGPTKHLRNYFGVRRQLHTRRRQRLALLEPAGRRAAGPGPGQTDLEERKATYTEVAQILNAEVPWIFLWSPNSLYGFRNTLQGFAPPSYSGGMVLWNAEEWTVTE